MWFLLILEVLSLLFCEISLLFTFLICDFPFLRPKKYFQGIHKNIIVNFNKLSSGFKLFHVKFMLRRNDFCEELWWLGLGRRAHLKFIIEEVKRTISLLLLTSQAQWQRALSPTHKVNLESKMKGPNQQCVFSCTYYLLSLTWFHVLPDTNFLVPQPQCDRHICYQWPY